MRVNFWKYKFSGWSKFIINLFAFLFCDNRQKVILLISTKCNFLMSFKTYWYKETHISQDTRHNIENYSHNISVQ